MPALPAALARRGDAISRLAVAIVALVLAILGAAAFLRLAQAGLGCPDWPACYGNLEANARVLQDGTAGTLVRLAHRVAALGAGALVLAAGWLVITRRPRRPAEVAAIAGMLALLVFLAVVGRWSSLSRIPAVPVANLLGGSALLALAWLLLLLQRPARPAPRAQTALLAWTALLAVFVQSGLGALVSAKYAALACGGWFSCPGASAELLGPALDLFADPAGLGAAFLATLQWAHHLGAAAALCLAALAAVAISRTPGGRETAAAILGTALAQAALGAAAVRLGHPLPLVLVHNLVANLLLLALVSATHHFSRGFPSRGMEMPA